MANDKMLRELEQCVEERDRIVASIDCSPVDVSRLSPRTQRAQTVRSEGNGRRTTASASYRKRVDWKEI